MKKRAKTQPRYLATLASVAGYCGVSETSLFKWRRHHDDFPKATKRGYSKSAIDAFLKRHQLGRFRPKQGGSAGLIEARIKRLLESAELCRLTKEELLRAQKAELAECLFATDVDNFHQRVASTVMGVITEQVEAIMAQIPVDAPSQEAYLSMRQSVLGAARELPERVAEAVGELRRNGLSPAIHALGQIRSKDIEN